MLIAIEPLLVLFFLHSIEMSTFISHFYQTNGIAQWLLLLLEKLFQSVFKPIFLAKLNNRMIGFSICVLIFFLFFLIKFSNTLRFQLLNTWWIFTMFTNWIYNVNLIDDEFFICQATYKRDEIHTVRGCSYVCWTYESKISMWYLRLRLDLMISNVWRQFLMAFCFCSSWHAFW